MTNQEANQTIVRIERTSLARSFLRSQINGFAVFAVALLALLAFFVGESFTASLLLGLMGFIVASSIFIRFKSYQRNQKIEFWKLVRKQGLSGEPPTGDTRLLIDKIIKIQTATPNNELLLMSQAVKLVAAYQRQSRQLELIKARLAKINATRQSLNEKIAQLQSLGENHSAGLRNLEQTRSNSNALQKVANEIQSSCDRLEAILSSVQKTARARQLRGELDQLSALNSAKDEAVESTFEAESLEDIERQIGREIETYLQLERETEEHLR